MYQVTITKSSTVTDKITGTVENLAQAAGFYAGDTDEQTVANVKAMIVRGSIPLYRIAADYLTDGMVAVGKGKETVEVEITLTEIPTESDGDVFAEDVTQEV